MLDFQEQESNVKPVSCEGVLVVIYFKTMYTILKQLFDSVFVISGIIKVFGSLG